MPGPRGEIVHGLNADARALGIGPGARAADVMAVTPDLSTATADLGYEVKSLVRLAAWARRWSPLTRPDGVDGIALDVTGTDHLFGGEAGLLADMRARLARQGLTVRLALAPCPPAAHALARFGAHDAIVEQADLAARIAPLPVEALGLTGPAVTLLRRLGLKTVGQLDRMPRASLKRRFRASKLNRDPRDDTWEQYGARLAAQSGDVVAQLDAIHARTDVPLDPERDVAPARIARGLPEPVFTDDAVLHHAALLTRELTAVLDARGEGVRTLTLEAFRTDGGRAATRLGLTRATRDADHLVRLLAERLAGWRAEFGFDAMAVEAMEVQPVAPAQVDTQACETAPDVAGLIDRLSTRLGAAAVLRPEPVASHLPERAEHWTPALRGEVGALGQPRAMKARGRPTAPGGNARTDPRTGPRTDPCTDPWARPSGAPRPERLLETPEEIGVLYALPEGPPRRFTWRGRTHDVARTNGPERIAPEWWRERGGVRARDYYRVETNEGLRVWVYREGFADDARGGSPRWFLQGLFS